MNSPKQTEKNSTELTTAYTDYNRRLNSYATFKLHDNVIGEGLVQDTFTKTWNYMVKGGKVTIMKAFLYHILNNLIIDEYRKQKHTAQSLDTLLEKGYEPKDEEADRLPNFIDGSRLITLIALLPDLYKKVMYMRFVQSMSLSEISLGTGENKNSISVKIHRGLEKLKILYESTPARNTPIK